MSFGGVITGSVSWCCIEVRAIVVMKTGLERQTITADANCLFIFVLPLGSEHKLWMLMANGQDIPSK